MIEFLGYSFQPQSFAILSTVGVLIGLSKTGVKGTSMLAVPLLATVFGGKASSGVMLPALILADIIGVSYYHRHAQFNYLWKLMPWTIMGVLSGTYLGQYIDDELFKDVMGGIVIISLAVMIWLERSGKEKIPDYWWFAGLMGIIAGFTTMVGNLAGTAMAIYLLSMRLPKNQFIGTTAWFFIAVNVFKVPFHVWSWETITLNSFLLDLTLLPFIGIGALLGIKTVKLIPDNNYRWFVIGMTAIAVVFMVL